MQDGATEITCLDKTEDNRALARSFTEQVLIGRQLDLLPDYVRDDLIQHSPDLADGLPALQEALAASDNGAPAIQYQRLHRVLAEGNFVLCASEGHLGGVHTSFYDLYRIADGKIAEHWDTVETIPPRSAWKNNNGKF